LREISTCKLSLRPPAIEKCPRGELWVCVQYQIWYYSCRVSGDLSMSKRNVKKSLQELLTLARKLAETPGLTWVEANNAIYAPGGPFMRLFPTKADQAAFQDSEERPQIDALIDSLPEPKVRLEPKEYSGKFNVRIPKTLHAALATEAEAEGVSLNQLVLAKLSLRLLAR
jgi:hypothetical protein